MKLTEYFEHQNILEIGTSLGLGTSAILFGNKEAHVKRLKDALKQHELLSKCLRNMDLENIHLELGNFQETLPDILSKSTYDLIYIDGQPLQRCYHSVLKMPSIHS